MRRCLLITLLALSALTNAAARADTYTITFDQTIRQEPASGRIILFFISETGRMWDRRQPMAGPFFESPQPIASIAVHDLKPGEPAVIDGADAAFPAPLDELVGTVRVQAILDLQENPERSHTDGPGNLHSDVLTFTLTRDADEHHHLALTNIIPKRELPPDAENLKWVEFRSELLSEFYGRDVYHRAGVALPMAYLDDDAERRQWPAIYVVPGFGSRHSGARMYASMFRSQGIEQIAPMAVTIVLDPESPLGHHGFTDTANHGPRGTAFVSEFIPYLEKQFRLVAEPEARLVTGHSSGGWTSLWLQLNWPNVFGACFSSAPDPVDFTAFQMTNLYEDESVYVMADGSETPSYREMVGIEDRVAMTVRQECLMEHAIHPLGGSGQQWDTWMAMFSPKDPETGFPKRLFDHRTGEIDRTVLEHWKQFDIARMVRNDWETYGPIVTQRIRLACGERDNYYLQRAVRRFQQMVNQLRGDDEGGDGYILLQDHADHSNLMAFIYQRFNSEMREHFRKHGYHD